MSIALGIGIGLFASCLQSLGLTIQRRSHVEDQNLPLGQQRSEYRRPLFLLGFSIFISSNLVGSVLQIIVLPIIILAPLGAISLLWNALFARLLLGDVFSHWLILGTIGIIAGALLIAFFGIVPETTRSLEDLIQLFSRPAFITYFSLLSFVIIVCLVTTHITEFTLSRRIATLSSSPETGSSVSLAPRSHSRTDPSVLTTGLVENVGEELPTTERTPLLSAAHRTPSSDSSLSSSSTAAITKNSSIARTRTILAFSYASFSGILSGMCLLFAKSGVELLLLTIQGNNQFWRWQAWMLVFGLVAFALLQLWYLHKALVLASPTLVCPSAFCFYNLSSIVNGLVYFDQFSSIPPLHLGLVGLGIVILLGGVWAVSIQPGEDVDIVAWNEDTIADEEDSILDVTDDVEVGKAARLSLRHDGAAVSDTDLTVPTSIKAVTVGQALGRRISPLSHPSHTQEYTQEGQRRKISRNLAVDSDVSSPHTHSTHHSHQPRSPSFHFTQFGPLSPQMGATVASTIAAGGLQIGLSPISPGFSLVPKRPRRGSNVFSPPPLSMSRSDTLPLPLHAGPSTTTSDALSALGFGRRPLSRATDPRRRRTVSEGDVARLVTHPSLAAAAENLRNDSLQADDDDTRHDSPGQPSSPHIQERRRGWWKRLTGRR
ncbi:hypothetical protein DL96DRAFT_1575550 [Flagelloscypha sp. PMI_526]|nr:hypothetical protein DL96DRAFT_1575550 [Flagelloscypha sp. PMI_526]